ncbi:MAG: PIG-L family deacetylase [Gemmatimonadaceae bacterium]|nr:PIG-L family deacetylase [Gemmatimonadaceae bacterium]
MRLARWRAGLWAGVLCTMLSAPRLAFGQERGAAALDQLLRGITVTGRVLMVAAHPDDEDTNLLAALVRGHQVHAAYLSLTRGDGGQNLIGNELGEALGTIRTEELLTARRVDGATQYFTRAYDFGFSKHAEETFTQWDREAILGDVVRVIRAFKPHVMVAVFSGTRADGHGHHEASGLLAREAFAAAMDTIRFPVATHGRPWTPAKFYHGVRGRAAPLTIEAGRYDPVLGRSPAEIAGESRSQHRSQGFGAVQRRGAVQTRLLREQTRVNADTPPEAEQSLFDGLDTSFVRLARLAGARGSALVGVPSRLDSLQRVLDLRRPGDIVPGLARVVTTLEYVRTAVPRCQLVPVTRYTGISGPPVLCDDETTELDAAVEGSLQRARAALAAASGVLIEATAQQELVAFGDSLPVRINVYNRGIHPVELRTIETHGLRTLPLGGTVTIAPGADTTINAWALGLVDSRPWWVGTRGGTAMFRDMQSPADGLARVSAGVRQELIPSVSVAEGSRRVTDLKVGVMIAGYGATLDAGEVVYRFADPVLGEQNRPVGGVPPITIALDRTLEYVRADTELDRRLRVTLRSFTTRPRTLRFRTLVPPGLRVSGLPDSVVLAPGATQEIYLTLVGRLREGRHDFGVAAESEGTLYVEGFSTIEYPHIRPQRLYRQSAAYLLAVPVQVPRALRVAYVRGVSDAVAPVLQQLDIPVTVLEAAQLPLLDLTQYSTVVIGPRAYETSVELQVANPRLFEWVRGGGTLVVQYGQFEMAQPGMMPQRVQFTRPAARVTREDAPVRILDAQSKLLRWPNRITDADWSDWVQERALYMPSTIPADYRTPIAMQDPDEPEQRGAILDLPMGRGRYVYTSLSLFRQLPGGVPGGARLMVNLLSAGLPIEPSR